MDDGKRFFKLVLKLIGFLTSGTALLIIPIIAVCFIVIAAVAGQESELSVTDYQNDNYVVAMSKVQQQKQISGTLNIELVKRATVISNQKLDEQGIINLINTYFIKTTKTPATKNKPATTTFSFLTDTEIINNKVLSKPPFNLSDSQIEQITKSIQSNNQSSYPQFSPYASTGKLGWPFVSDYYISCPYGGYSGHNGIDLSCADALGKPVYAAADGKVLSATTSNVSYGNCVVINHTENMATRYAHLQRIITHTGATIKKGELIGLCGTSGNSTGPHLHFEVIINGQTVNPTFYLFGW